MYKHEEIKAYQELVTLKFLRVLMKTSSFYFRDRTLKQKKIKHIRKTDFIAESYITEDEKRLTST